MAEYLSGIAMVDFDRGITNLHVPSDVIIDASMPAMLRDSMHVEHPRRASSREGRHSRPHLRRRVRGGGRRLQSHGADPTTMGSVPNVGLMAKKAEEYGSHDKTFEMSRRARCE